MTSKLKIVDTANFSLWSFNNGAAYELRHDASETSLCFQYGDDAKVFRDEWEAVEMALPHKSTDEVMLTLWRMYYMD
jgi:hypothetical protein